MGAETEVRARATEADVVRVVAGDVECVRVVEDGIVPVAGAVEQHHLVALVEDRVAQSGTVLGDGSAEVDHRACVPDDFLHGAGHVGVEIALEQCLLLRVVGEVGEAPADRVAGRFVACCAEQDEKALDLVAGQFVAVDLGVDERMGERVAVAPVGLARNVIDESGQGGTGAKERFERILSLRHEFGIALAEDDVRHVEDELVLTLGDAHHVADDLDG